MLTTDFVPGAPNWIDLASRDTTAAAAFYASLLGWEFTSAGPEAGGYGTFVRDGKTVAAMGPLVDDGASPAWTVYFHTADADTTSEAVEKAGGLVRFAAKKVFDQGRIAGYTDPSGAEFAVWEPNVNKGIDHVGPWGLYWTELFTSDAERAKEFYGAVFSWDQQDLPLPDNAPADTRTVISPSGAAEGGSHGDIMQLPPQILVRGSYWQPYFEVDDVDATVARATAGGATVVMPPTDMTGIGRLSLVRDPEGAAFTVITPEAS